MFNFFKNKKGNSVTMILLLPVWLIMIFLVSYEVEIANCKSELEDDVRVALRIASLSTDYETALTSANLYLQSLEEGYDNLTDSNLKIYAENNYEILDVYDEENWKPNFLLELTLTKKSSFYGGSAFDLCSFDGSCSVIVPTTVATSVRMYISNTE